MCFDPTLLGIDARIKWALSHVEEEIRVKDVKKAVFLLNKREKRGEKYFITESKKPDAFASGFSLLEA